LLISTDNELVSVSETTETNNQIRTSNVISRLQAALSTEHMNAAKCIFPDVKKPKTKKLKGTKGKNDVCC